MFGYLMVNKDSLDAAALAAYRSFYCGLCHRLTVCYGLPGKLALNYETAFLALLLTSLYEEETTFTARSCSLHPLKKKPQAENQILDYAADMTVLLAYYQCVDHVVDGHSRAAALEARWLKKAKTAAAQNWPVQAQAMADYLAAQAELETAGETDLDRIAAPSGQMVAALFQLRTDEWTADLQRFGYYLGKFLYLMDAYEDLERDLRQGSFNALRGIAERADFDQLCHDYLHAQMADATDAFERLPLLTYVDALRNILYSGVWTHYQLTRSRRAKQRKEGCHGSV